MRIDNVKQVIDLFGCELHDFITIFEMEQYDCDLENDECRQKFYVYPIDRRMNEYITLIDFVKRIDLG